MKKLIALFLITLSVSAMAQHGHGYRQGPGHGHGHGAWVRGYGSGWGWGVPAVIGGLLVYEAVKQPTYVQQPVYVQQQPTYTTSSNPTCTPWTEVQSSDGTVTRTRTCTQ
jgi:hypothetical protein